MARHVPSNFPSNTPPAAIDKASTCAKVESEIVRYLLDNFSKTSLVPGVAPTPYGKDDQLTLGSPSPDFALHDHDMLLRQL